MSLPVSRNTTYAASSQVKSADLNDVQDQICTLHSRLNDPRTLVIPYAAGMDGFGSGLDPNFLGYIQTTAAAVWVMPISLDDGRQITAARVRIRSHNVNTIAATLRHAIDGANTTDASATSATGAGASDVTLTLTPGSPVLVQAGIHAHYRIHLIASGTDLRIYQAEVDYEWAP